MGILGIIGVIGLVLSAAATTYGVVSSIKQANEQAELAQKQAQAKAASLREQAAQEEQDQLQRSLIERRQNARKLAAAEAGYAASGVSLAGTPTLSLASMASEQELDVIMQEASSGRKRELLLADAYNTEKFGDWGADLTRSSGVYSAVGLGLSGTADAAYKGYRLKKNGDI